MEREVLTGLSDVEVKVSDYFEAFDWEGPSLDADEVSAADFLSRLD